MSDRTLLNRAQVAIRLGITVECFYRKRRDLEAQGFPPPAFGRMSGERWDPAAIDHWLDAMLPPAALSRDAAGEDKWAAQLDNRVALVALGGR